MLRDITIGQHFPGNSVVHRCDPRLKIIATIAYIIVLFMASNPLGIALSLALLALLYKVAQIPIKLIVKSLKPIVPIVLFTAVLNLFFITAGTLWLYPHLPRGCELCGPDGGAHCGIDRRHQPVDLHHQPHCADGCH